MKNKLAEKCKSDIICYAIITMSDRSDMKVGFLDKQEIIQSEKRDTIKDVINTYHQFKEFGGKRYTGMKVGRSHKWYYDKGEWKERKISPDKWEFDYAVTKQRAGHAPEGSGAPVGTEYHWYILAHQIVRKLDANKYSTSMTGLKYKLAHKRADKEKWSSTDKAQRARLAKILQKLVIQLKEDTSR